MIVGLTGRNASGKGVVADFLRERGFVFHSLSDIIRDDLRERNSEVTRENLIEAGRRLRKTYGASVLADRILAKLEPDKNYVIDSFRNPYEVEAFRRAGHYVLVDVTADAEIRFKRIQERKRESDPMTLDAFMECEQREDDTSDSAQQLTRTAQLADLKIENNGSLDALHERIREALVKVSSRLTRPSWDEYFMGIARMVAMRSNCIKRKVAAVIVKDRRIISTGYNGTPRGVKNCIEGGCPRCNNFDAQGKNLSECLCSHAEENSITQASYHGVSIKDASLYTTFSPCLICTKMIINSGIQEVVYSVEYALDDLPLRLLNEAGIKVRQLDNSPKDPNQKKDEQKKSA